MNDDGAERQLEAEVERVGEPRLVERLGEVLGSDHFSNSVDQPRRTIGTFCSENRAIASSGSTKNDRAAEEDEDRPEAADHARSPDGSRRHGDGAVGAPSIVGVDDEVGDCALGSGSGSPSLGPLPQHPVQAHAHGHDDDHPRREREPELLLAAS